MRPHDRSDPTQPTPSQGTDSDEVLYRVTVTSRVTGRRDTVEVPASSARMAHPVACAWYPLLPLGAADVEVVEARRTGSRPPAALAA